MQWTTTGRVCTSCNIFKDWTEFSDKHSKRYKHKQDVKIHQIKQPKCKSCANKETVKWRESQSPERLKDLYLRRMYNITYVQYTTLLESQNYTCKICQRELNTKFGMEALSPDTAVIDHCHTTGRVRGILCNECNRGLGYFKDNINSLAKAISYLSGEETSGKGVAHAIYHERTS